MTGPSGFIICDLLFDCHLDPIVVYLSYRAMHSASSKIPSKQGRGVQLRLVAALSSFVILSAGEGSGPSPTTSADGIRGPDASLRGCEEIDLVTSKTSFLPLPEGTFCSVWGFPHSLSAGPKGCTDPHASQSHTGRFLNASGTDGPLPGGDLYEVHRLPTARCKHEPSVGPLSRTASPLSARALDNCRSRARITFVGSPP